jgi:hypothetical protein
MRCMSFGAALHAIGHVVREQHAVRAGRHEREEVIEGRDATDLGQRQPEKLRDAFERRSGK